MITFILTYLKKVITAGICLADISDHLPIFCSIANKLPVTNEIKYIRDFSKFDNEAFLNALANVDFRSLVTKDVNESMHRVTETLQQISDLHAPMRKVSNKKKEAIKKNMDFKCNHDLYKEETKAIQDAFPK